MIIDPELKAFIFEETLDFYKRKKYNHNQWLMDKTGFDFWFYDYESMEGNYITIEYKSKLVCKLYYGSDPKNLNDDTFSEIFKIIDFHTLFNKMKEDDMKKENKILKSIIRGLKRLGVYKNEEV